MGKPIVNEDGVSIKGCSYIYAPKGQAGEYAPLAANPYRGCGHGCAYCYVPLVTKQPRQEFDAGAVLRRGYAGAIEQDAIKYQRAGITEQVMMSFTTDPYHPGDTIATRDVIDILKFYGLGFCTLTKGGARALRDIDLFRPERDAFASTLTTLDDAFSLKWEKSAALPADRIDTLKRFHERGIYTWVSLEPTLDVEASLSIIDATCEFVNLYKIGRANYVPTITKVVDWKEYTLRMLDRLHKAPCRPAFYFKKDLQPYVPAGVVNTLRRPQCFPDGI